MDQKQAVLDQKGISVLYWNRDTQYALLGRRDLRELYLLQQYQQLVSLHKAIRSNISVDTAILFQTPVANISPATHGGSSQQSISSTTSSAGTNSES